MKKFLLSGLVITGLIACVSFTKKKEPNPPPLPPPLPPITSTIKTDLGVYPVPTLPALPDAGGTYVDSVFGTTIMRVTDGSNCQVAYSYWPSMNLNNTYLHLNCSGVALLYKFDPVNFKILGKENLFPLTPSGTRPMWEDSIWSSIDANVLYAHDYKNLWAYNVYTKAYTLVSNIAAFLPSGNYLWQMSKSEDDNRFAWTEKNSAYANVGYVVYQRDTNSILFRKVGVSIDEARLDKSGLYLTHTTLDGAAGTVRLNVVDLTTKTIIPLVNGAPDYAPGHNDFGIGKMFGLDNWNNTVQYRNLSTPKSFTQLLSFGNDWTQAYHLSALANNANWVLLSSYVVGSAGADVFHNEIFQVATDGSGRVRRLAHHFSMYNSYEDSPKANISSDGQYAVFTSNWGGSANRYVFILKVPAAP